LATVWKKRLVLLLKLALLIPIACEGSEAIPAKAPPPSPPASEPSAADLVNGCNRAETPLTSDREVVDIHFGGLIGFAYEPACLRIRAGTRVRFVGPFATHPLAAGRVFEEEVVVDPESPFKSTWEGETAAFMMLKTGDVAYYCDEHAFEGMFGAVFVE
jgi:plastocyanin